MRLDEAVPLEAAEQWIDGALADNGQAARAEPLRHLVPVRGLLGDDRKQAEVEHSPEQLAATALGCCHAAQGTTGLPCDARLVAWFVWPGSGNPLPVIAPDRSFPNGSPVCEYWLSRCEGFTVRAGHRVLGVVDTVEHFTRGGQADRLVLRKRRRRRRTLATDDVLAVVPARKLLLARRHQHAKPALDYARHAVETATPVVVENTRVGAARAWALTKRLTQLALAEIHDRNLHHGDEPGVGRAHRRANDYAFAVQQPLGRGRNVGPMRRP